MTSDSPHHSLLNEFQQFLQQEHTHSMDLFDLSKQPDLHTLLSEIAGLKAEVKAESRQFKQTLDTLSTALSEVQGNNQKLLTELDLAHQNLIQQKNELMRTMLLEWIDIYDRLKRGEETLENYRSVRKLFKKSNKKDIPFIESFKQGQSMTLNRFEELLNSHQVRAIDCLGKKLDPITMTAVEIEVNKQYANGIVLEELRQGFYFQDQILRLAEVKVNKLT